MTQNKKDQLEEPIKDDAQLGADVEELKRDMRSAKIADWLQKNQQKLIAATVVILVIVAGAGLWAEKQQTIKESAAMVYFQALSAKGDTQKTLLEKVIQDYSGTGYSILAHIRLAPLADTEKHLRAVMNNSSATPEFQWQARLDLAEYLIQHDKSNDAKTLLNQTVGTQFEQLRFYLLAKTSTGDEQVSYLKKALDAVSNDAILKSKIEAELAQAGV